MLRTGIVWGTVLLLVVTPASAKLVRQLNDVVLDDTYNAMLDDAGTLVVASSSSDPFGTNPNHAFQVLKWSLPGAANAQVGSFAKGVVSTSVTDDGQTIAFVSPADPAGQNPDGSLELFLMAPDGTGFVQLTNNPGGPGSGSVNEALICGSGSTAVFRANADLTGGNPSLLDQLFAVDTGSLVVTQLTTATEGGVSGFSISDNGQRIVFSHSGEPGGGGAADAFRIFGIESDGTGLNLLASASPVNYRSPQISGNGTQLVFEDGDNVLLVGWTGLGLTTLGLGASPSITDDGKWVYLSADDGSNWEIFRFSTSGGPPTQITFTDSPFYNTRPVVSGGHARIAFNSSNGTFPGGDNPDGGTELYVMDVNGSNIQQLTAHENSGYDFEVDVTPDGSRVVFTTTGQRDGGLSDQIDIWRIQSDGSGLTQVTSGARAYHPDVSNDGSKIVFYSADNLTGVNTCSGGFPQVFVVQDDGSGLLQLTPPDNCDINDHAVLSGDGNTVVFQAVGFSAPYTGPGLYSIPSTGGTMTHFVNDGDSLRKNPNVSDDGQWAVYHSQTDNGGQNYNNYTQVYRARTDGSLVEQVTTDPESTAWRPDISADGDRVTYVSDGDPLGTNADHNVEVFVTELSSATTWQLTTTGSGTARDPRISGDGNFVYFLSSAPLVGPSPGERLELYRVEVATGTIDRAGGLVDPRSILSAASLRNSTYLAVDSNGSKATFRGFANATGENPDFSSQVFFVDFVSPSLIYVSKDAPTLVSCDPEPDTTVYDVIRGDVANLQLGPGGLAIDLGTVICIEDDSPDNTTVGHEDVAQPAPGQTFFYVFRGGLGPGDPGTWGEGSGGLDRVPGAGTCTD
ncbi:MAG: hypothetical protein GY716_14975 [bacterium]|nr:hypothetical protein [bacterium]